MAYALLGILALLLVLLGQTTQLRLLSHLRGALLVVGLASVAVWGVDFLDDPSWSEWPRIGLLGAISYLIARIIIVVIFEWLLTRRTGIEVPRLARDVVAILIYLVTAATVLRTALGIEVGALLATSAVLTVVVGLALQETLGTLLAGLAMAWEQRLQTGQWVEIDGTVGEVVELGWRSLIIRTRFGNQILIPNSNVARDTLRLLGRGDQQVAIPIRLGVAYGAAPDQVKQVLLAVAQGLPDVLANPAARVLVHEWADSAIVYECRLWTTKPWLHADFRDELLTRAYSALARNGMEIPFPQRTVHMAQARPPRSPDQIRQALEACDLFSGLPAPALHALAEHCRWLRFAPGEVVMLEGDDSRAMYVVGDGTAVIERYSTEIYRLTSGETFGEIAFLTGAPRIATVRAADALCIVEIANHALAALLEEHQHLAEELAQRVATRQVLPEAPDTTDQQTEAGKGLVALLRDGLLRLVGASTDKKE